MIPAIPPAKEMRECSKRHLEYAIREKIIETANNGCASCTVYGNPGPAFWGSLMARGYTVRENKDENSFDIDWGPIW